MLSTSFARKLLPIAAFLLFGAVALALWWNQSNHERELVLRHTETSAEQVRIRVEGFMMARIASLELIADRWVEKHPPDFSQHRFLGFAEVLYRRYPGYLGIFWIDPGGVVQWVYPQDAHREKIGKLLTVNSKDGYPEALARMRNGASLAVMPCVPLRDGGVGFHVLRSLTYINSLQGYLDTAFEVGQILNVCLSERVLKDFRIRLYEGDRIIYQKGYANETSGRGEPEPGEGRVPRAVREIRFAGSSWTLKLEPSLTAYPDRSVQNFSILFFGLALSAALALLIYFLIERMDMLRASRDQALHEVSERKRAQEALRENERKLEALLDELKDKNVELESFVYTVSHDLKTPIVTIEGFIGALREDFGQVIPEGGERYLQYMSDAARKMESLINDLLNLSRIGRLAETKREFSLDIPVHDTIELLRPQIKARGITIDVQSDLPVVYAERKRIGQVIDNLVANAVKYIGKDNPGPRIEIGSEVQNGEQVFFVRDNGIGIEEKYFDKIFQIFQRLPSAKRVGDGTGIGLTIVKRIIEHHGGRIWLISEPGKGSTFYFTIQDKEAV